MNYVPLTPERREALVALLRDSPAFDPSEEAVATELVDIALADPEQREYRFILAEISGDLAGYVCFGPTPMTKGTVDLYWLATHPNHQRKGVAKGLLARMDAQLAVDDARLVRVETSSQEIYGAALGFYHAAGFQEEARIADFYSPGDDLIIFMRRLGATTVKTGGSVGLSFGEVYDVAFRYRNFAAERDFLIACATEFGAGRPRRVLEWATGPARHLEAFAALGDIECVGVDLAPSMVDMARRRIGHLPSVSILEGDARTCVVEPTVGLAFTLLGSVHELGSDEDVMAHLRTSARALDKGGVLVIEATHPNDLTPAGTHQTQWEEQEGDVSVSASFRLHIDEREDSRVPVTLSLASREGKRSVDYRAHGSWHIPDLEGWDRITAAVPELEVVARLGDLDTTVRHDSCTAWRLVLVLRRR